MQSIHVFEVDLNLLGTDDLYNKIHFLGYNVFQVSHLAMEYIYDEDSEFQSNSPIEIGAIRKVIGIQNIVNPFFAMAMAEEDQHEHEENYNGSIPLEMGKKLPDEAIIDFSCQCHEKLRVPQGYWPFVTCPTCDIKILRREIKNVGGLFFYKKLDDNKK